MAAVSGQAWNNLRGCSVNENSPVDVDFLMEAYQIAPNVYQSLATKFISLNCT